MSDILSDETIASFVIKGDAIAYKEIINRYKNKIFSIGMRFFKNKHDAEDFAQDVFIRAYEKISTFAGKSFGGWIIRIAYNHGITKIKSMPKSTESINENINNDSSDAESRYFRSEIESVVKKAIDSLPEKYRICVDLFFFWGMTYNEISSITDIPLNTIKSNVLRAKIILRNHLKGTIAEDYHEM